MSEEKMVTDKTLRKTWIWLSLFSISMGFMESAVVVYLREIIYPGGFNFPLAPVETRLAVTEILREAATIIMLLAAGYLGGRSFSERFAWFLYCFAIWDILYYVFLKLLINWPESLMTWDILFLIPVAWTGPVITPVLVSLTMMFLAGVILYFSYRSKFPVRILTREWLLLIFGSLLLIIAFVWDYCTYVIKHIQEGNLTGKTDKQALNNILYEYIPLKFDWSLYAAGEIIILAATLMIIRRCRKTA